MTTTTPSTPEILHNVPTALVAMRLSTASDVELGRSKRMAPQVRLPRKASSTKLRRGVNPTSDGVIASKSAGPLAFTIIDMPTSFGAFGPQEPRSREAVENCPGYRDAHEMHVLAYGLASSRAGAIGSPQLSQTP